MGTSVDTLRQLTQLAESFGPFFFALLFVLVVTRTARKYYDDACRRTNPPATQEEIDTYKLYFRSASIFGIVLVVLAIAWWGYFQTRKSYTYQIAITELQPSVTIEAPYFSRQTIRPSAVLSQAISDDFFLIVQDHPFNVGDRFLFNVYILSKPTQTSSSSHAKKFQQGDVLAVKQQTVEVTYKGKDQESYSLKLDPEKGVKFEPSIASNQSHSSFFTASEIRQAQLTHLHSDGLPNNLRVNLL